MQTNHESKAVSLFMDLEPGDIFSLDNDDYTNLYIKTEGRTIHVSAIKLNDGSERGFSYDLQVTLRKWPHIKPNDSTVCRKEH